MQKKALVVIDLQNDITKNYRDIIGNVNRAIDWAVRNELWVVYIQHNNLSAGTRTFKQGTHGAELVPEMKVVSDLISLQSQKAMHLQARLSLHSFVSTALLNFMLPVQTLLPA